MRKLFWLLIFLFPPLLSEAAHHTSGYISIQYMGGNTYQATFVDFTIGNPMDTGICGTNDQDTIRIWWGDNQSTLLYRSNGNGGSICDCKKVNDYVGTHTYAGPGNYKLYVDAIGRAAGITNIPGSVGVDMFIFNYLTIPLTGFSPPVITNQPICSYGCPSDCYYFNLNASSPGGDSLSYSLGNCLQYPSIICAGYTNPGATINPVTGKLKWCKPSDGTWNFALLIITYKREVNIYGKDTVTIQIPVDTEEVELEMEAQSNCTTGIDQISSKDKFIIYPNPSNGLYTIESLTSTTNLTIGIYNMLGEKVYTQTLNRTENTAQLDLRNNSSGIYLYRILSETGDIVSEGKFIIE